MGLEMIATKKIAQNREIEALKNLVHFGFLTTKSIAELTEGVTGDAALKSAKRVLKRLIVKKEVLRRSSRDGILCYVLTKTGAARAKPFTLMNSGKSGAELETRFAKRQELIVSKLIEIKKTFGGVLLGEIYLKRDKNKYFIGLHGQVWNLQKNEGVGVYFISSLRSETAEHVLKLQMRLQRYIKHIYLISFDETAERILTRKIRLRREAMPQPLIDL